MRVIEDLRGSNLERGSIVTVGVFDGVHLGHTHLIRGMVEEARTKALLAGAVTFDPHPHQPILCLSGLEERVRLLEALGLDFLVILPFTPQLACTPAEDFIRSLSESLGMQEIWEGRGFVFGYRREGDITLLERLAPQFGFEVHVVDTLSVDGVPVSSSKIRALIQEGKVEEAARFLGRYPTIRGRVVAGAKRGKGLGFPTANLELPERRVIPADGVYAARARWGSENHPAVANVGTRPTFGEGNRLVEAHLLDFQGDLYSQEVELEFRKRLRPERKFASIEGLVSQMGRDILEVRRILENEAPKRGGKRYQEIEHTADAAIKAYGRDLPELFTNAAYGMFDLLADMEKLHPTVEREVSLEAPDLEALLVDWLSELLYLREVKDEVYKEFEISALSPTELRAVAKGGRRFVPRMDIKAVTYHQLEIERTDEGYAATIVFDV